MHPRPIAAVLAACFALATVSPCAYAGRLDLDLSASQALPYTSPGSRTPSAATGLGDLVAPAPRLPGRPGARRGAGEGWRPGDPRDVAGEPAWVQAAAHAGYTGLAVAGFVASLATGGTAPAVGFAVVAAVQAVRGWRLHRALAEEPRPAL